MVLNVVSHTAIALPIKIYKRKTRLEDEAGILADEELQRWFFLPWFLTKTRVVPNFDGLFMFIWLMIFLPLI